MLSITIGSSSIPVDPNISLPLVLRSPLFITGEGKIPGSYIFNYRFPATNAIRQEFGQAHRVTKNGRATAELPYLITHGILRYQGNCLVTQVDSDYYEVAFKIDNGDFASKLKDKTLKDLDLGGERTIATIMSSAFLATRVWYDKLDDFSLFTIQFLDTISVDITSSLQDSGHTFVTPDDFVSGNSVNLKIMFSCAVFYCSMELIIKINNIPFYAHSFGQQSETVYQFEHTLVLNAGDVVTLRMFGEPDEYGRSSCHINLAVVTFSTSVLFDQVISDPGGQNTNDFAIFPIKNERLLDNFPDDAFQIDNLSIKTLYSSYFPVINYFANGKFPLMLSGIKDGEAFTAANLFTPFVYMNKLLNQIASEAGYSVINSPFTDEFEGAVLFNAFSENSYNSDNTRLTPVKPTVNLSDHVPDIKQTDFINYISQLTGYLPVIDNNLLTITFVKVKEIHIETSQNPSIAFPGIMLPNPLVKVSKEYNGIIFELIPASADGYQGARIKKLHDKLAYKGEVAHINNLPPTGNLVNDMYKVTSDNSYYVWQYNETTYTLTWCFFSRDWPLLYKDGVEPYLTITSGFSPVLTTFIKDEVLGAPENRFWTIPVTWQPGILEGFPESFSSEYGIQMLIYRGMVLDSNDELYPLGTSRTEDYANDLFVNLNAREIFNSQWKEFLEFIAYQTKPVTVKAILNTRQLRSINFATIYRTDRFSFLIKEIKVNMLHDGLSVAEMEIYTC